jgi:serine/threonine protein phosphatase PrpC
MATTVREAVAADPRAATDPAALAEELVAWANRRGGHDNISVALARIG